MTHGDFISSILRSVRADGAALALAQVRAARPAFHVHQDRDGKPFASYHDTRAVFYVWAVDRLVAGGLSDFGVMWHPLLDTRSPLVWWTRATLESAEATESFVASDLARLLEPQPVEPADLLAA